MRYESNDSQHVIFHGDVLDVLPTIRSGSVDLIFSDPPYNIGKQFGPFKDIWPSDDAYVSWCRRWIDHCCRILKDSGSFYIMASTQAMPMIDLYVREKIDVLGRLVWCYDSSGVQAKRFFGSSYEPILYGVKDRSRYTFNSADILVEAKTGAKRKLIDYRKAVPAPYNTTKVPSRAVALRAESIWVA